MYTYYTIILDGCEGYEEWASYEVKTGHVGSFEAMIEDIESALEDLGGGHADIFDEDGNFVNDIEV